MITQKALAQQLNVSPQAVSFALNGTGRLADETREMILAAADAAGYQPNIAARAMAQQRFGCVALVQHHEARFSYVQADMLQVLQEHLNEQGLHLKMLWVNPADIKTPKDLASLASKYQVDGLIMNLFFPDPVQLQNLLSCTKTPVVWLNLKEAQNCVYPDDYQAGRVMARKLLEKGLTQFIYCDRSYHNPIHHYSKDDRWRGVKDEIEGRGFEVMLLERADRKTIQSALQGRMGDLGFLSYSLNEIEATLVVLLESFPALYHHMHFSTIVDPGAFGTLSIERQQWPGTYLAEKGVKMLTDLLSDPVQRLPSICIDYLSEVS